MSHGSSRKYSDELRRRAIDEVLERARKVPEAAEQLGLVSPDSLLHWVRQGEIDRDPKAGPSSEELTEFKASRREVADQQ